MKPWPDCRNLQLLRESGAEVVFFSPLTGSLPEGTSGIYLGGGYPELHAADLSSRRDLKAAVKAFAEAGGVVYAECGGLLYLSQSIQPLNRMPSSMGRVHVFLQGRSCDSGQCTHQQGLIFVMCMRQFLPTQALRAAWRRASKFH